MALRLISSVPERDRRILEFDCGVRAYPPAAAGGYWRIRWEEDDRHRDTTAASREAAVAKAAELVERLGRGMATDLAKSSGADLVAHYLDPRRRPQRVEAWSERHRDEQVRYSGLYVLPVIAPLACRRLTRSHFQRILDAAPTASVGTHLGRVLTALVGAGLEEGYLLARQDVLRGVRWRARTPTPAGPAGRAITEAEIPTTAAVHALARAAAERSGVWWRECQILFVAYSGLRWGEHVALSADRIDARRRRVTVDRQVVETRSALKESLPKGRRCRVTMFPATTPGGADLAGMVETRLAEVGADGLVFPAPRGGWARRSNYGRNLWDPAVDEVGWPRDPERGWAWTFHSLRHVFATWALAQDGIRIEDVSRLLGHSSIRVTQEIYIHVTDDVYDRFYAATT